MHQSYVPMVCLVNLHSETSISYCFASNDMNSPVDEFFVTETIFFSSFARRSQMMSRNLQVHFSIRLIILFISSLNIVQWYCVLMFSFLCVFFMKICSNDVIFGQIVGMLYAQLMYGVDCSLWVDFDSHWFQFSIMVNVQVLKQWDVIRGKKTNKNTCKKYRAIKICFCGKLNENSIIVFIRRAHTMEEDWCTYCNNRGMVSYGLINIQAWSDLSLFPVLHVDTVMSSCIVMLVQCAFFPQNSLWNF